jgi:preprotein translocase subunit SecE
MARSSRTRGGFPSRPSPAPAAAGAASADPARPRVTLTQFAREVRAEGRKITWPSRKETWITSVMVFIMVVLASIFFALVDGALSFILQQLLRWVSQ